MQNRLLFRKDCYQYWIFAFLLLFMISSCPVFARMHSESQPFEAYSPQSASSDTSAFISVSQPVVPMEKKYPIYQIPIRQRLSKNPAPPLKSLQGHIRSLLAKVKQKRLPSTKQLLKFRDKLLSHQEEQLSYFNLLRNKLKHKPDTSIAHKRLNAFEERYKQQINAILEKISTLAEEIENHNAAPHRFRAQYLNWERQIDDLLKLIGKTKNKPKITGSDTRTLPFGQTETEKKGLPPETTGYPPGYEFPPAGYHADAMHMGETSSRLSYLEESPWNVTTLEMIDLVHQLDDNPVKIYKFVLNQCESQFYYGAMKGAQATLEQRAGNDYDQASLLMALYRVLNIPCRYVRGIIEVPVQNALNWTGLNDVLSVERFFQQAGIPCKLIDQDTTPFAFLVEHAWMEAFIPYGSYRGILEGTTGYQWIPLDPSATPPYSWQQGQDVLAQMSFDLQSELTEYSSTHRPDTSPVSFIRQRVEDYLNQNLPDTDYSLVLYQGRIIPEHIGKLSNTLPYRVKYIIDYYAYLPDEKTTSIRIKALYQGETLLDTSLPLCELLGGRLSLYYIPATEEDQEIADSFGGLYNTPPCLIDVLGVFRLNNTNMIIFTHPIRMGVDYNLRWDLITPSGTIQFTDTMIAGNFCAIGIGTPGLNYVQDDPPQYVADRLYYGRAAAYLDQLHSSEIECASLFRLRTLFPFPSIVVSGGVLDVEYLAGAPSAMNWKGMFLDVNLHAINTIAIDGNQQREKDFLTLTGAESSFLEGYVFKEGFAIDSVSTFDCIGLAHDLSIPVYDIDMANADTRIPLLTHPQEIIDEVTFSVNQGFTVLIPKDMITYLAWTGSGYIVHDPLTSQSGYFLSGSIAGGMTALSPEEINEWITSSSQDPKPSGEPVTDPSKAAKIIKLPSSDFQFGTVGEPLLDPLAIRVTDINGNPVSGVKVTFETIGNSGGKPIGNPDNTVTTDNQGNASTFYSLGTDTSRDPIYLRKNSGDEHPYQVGRHLIRATVTDTEITITEPFYAFAFPDYDNQDNPVQLNKVKGGGAAGILYFPLNAVYIPITYKAVDQYNNPVSNVNVTFAENGYNLLPGADEPTSSVDKALVVHLTPEEINKCGDVILYKQCGNQQERVDVITQAHGNAFAYAILGNVGAAIYEFTITADEIDFSESVSYTTCGYHGPDYHPPFYKPFGFSKRSPANDDGIIVEAYRVEEVTQPRQVFIYLLKEDYEVVELPSGIFRLEGKGTFTVEEITNAKVRFDASGEASLNPPTVNSAPYQTILTLGTQPGVYGISASSTPHYYVPVCDHNTGVVSSKLIENNTVSIKIPYVWALKGAVTNTDCLNLDENNSTIEDHFILYDFRPYNYPYSNLYLDILENDSRLYFSGATEGGCITIPHGMPFDRTATYKARLVVNKYYCHDQIKFDREDPDPERNEVKKIKFQRIKRIFIQDAEHKLPIFPGNDAKAKAETKPPNIPIRWDITSRQPFNPTHRISAEIHNTTGVITVPKDSREGVLTIRATDMQRECYQEMEVLVGCPPCEGSDCENTSGNGTAILRSIDLRFSLGEGRQGQPAGYITLKADRPKPNLATQSSLAYAGAVKGVHARTSQYGLHYVDAPRTYAQVVPLDQFSTEIRFYAKHENGQADEPFVTWRIENPDQSAEVYHRLQVTEIRAEKSIVTNYVWDEGSSTWTMTKGNGLRVETRSEQVSGDDIIITHTVKDGNGVVASKVRTTHHQYEWGKEVIKTVSDPDGDNLTSSYTYYDDLNDSGSYGKIETKVHPDGSWVRYEYDNLGRRVKEITPWLSGEGSAHVIGYDYTPVDTEDTDSPDHVKRPRVITETIAGTTVSKTYYSYILTAEGQRTEIEDKCINISVSFGDPSNIRTIKIYYPSGTKNASSGRLKQVQRPNGRLVTYTYEYGTYQGEGTFTPGAGDHFRQTIVHGMVDQPKGIAYKSTREITIRDPYGNDLYHESAVYDGTDYQKVDWTIYEYDQYGHQTKVINSNGTTAESVWGCCSKESEIDEQGIETTYTYDDLNRLETAVKVGVSKTPPWPDQDDITTQFTYDAEGRIMTTTVSGTTHNLTETKEYDLTGRLISVTDQAGLLTDIDYSLAGLVTTVIKPGGATEITTLYLDGSLKSVTGTSVVPRYYEYGVSADGSQWTKIFTGSAASPLTGSAASPRWEKIAMDALGRPVEYERPGFNGPEISHHYYNEKDQIYKTTKPGLADTIYGYDEFGTKIREGLDLNDNDKLDPDSDDRITETETSYQQLDGQWWLRTIARVYPDSGSNKPTITSIDRERMTGLGVNGKISEKVLIDIHGNKTISWTSIDPDQKKNTQWIKFPDSDITAESIYINGLLMSSKSRTGLVTTYKYDDLDRLTGSDDPRTGLSIVHFNKKGQVDYTEDAAGNRITNTYDEVSGRLIATTNANEKVSRYAYNDRDQITHTWGDVPYPTENVYDDYGQLSELHTYREGNNWSSETWPAGQTGPADNTIWHYHEPTGFLAAKKDAKGRLVQYEYTDNGKIDKRTWARQNDTDPIVTDYSYDPDTSDLLSVEYSDATPDVTYTYNRMGLKEEVTDAVGTRIFTYNDSLQLEHEAITGLYDRTITWTYSDSERGVKGRPTGLSYGPDYSVNFDYENTGRFKILDWNVNGNNHNVLYSYEPKSELLKKITIDGPGLIDTTTNYVYEQNRDLQTQVSNEYGTSLISQYEYTYNKLGLRKSVVNTGAAFSEATFTLYDYNDRNELLSADRYQGDNISDFSNPIDEEYRSYAYDPIGNRTKSTDWDNISGKQQTANYQTNELNQYIIQTLPGETRDFFYDEDGNLTKLTKDGKTIEYTYNAENRLISAAPQNPTGGDTKVDFLYDYNGRRVRKTVSTWSGGAWVEQTDKLFVYNYWNLIEEITSENGEPATSKYYVWGLDDSQSLHGSGGTGGLLAAIDDTSTFYFLNDSNGNVGQIVDSLTGTIIGHYEYDPFGNLLNVSGTQPEVNPFRFATKYYDVETKLIYYGYRHYFPELGRWLNRDPMSEPGGTNLYSFLANDAVNYTDYLGMYCDLKKIFSSWETAKGGFWGMAKAYATEGALKVAVKVGLRFVPFAGWLYTGYEVAKFIKTAHDVFHNFPEVANLWNELKNSAEFLQQLKCLSDEECDELAFQAGEAIGAVIINGRHAVKSLTRFMNGLRKKVGKKFGHIFGRKRSGEERINTTPPGSVGAMKRLEYESASYHGKTDTAIKSKAPTHGQDALDSSVQVKKTSPRRVGIDYETGEYVVFDYTSPGKFHGHVRSWKELSPEVQDALRKAGMADKKGRILRD